MEKDADSMVVKPIEYAASEYSASSEPPPVSSTNFIYCETSCRCYFNDDPKLTQTEID